LEKDSYSPGDNAKVYIASAAKNSKVLVQMEANGQIVKSKSISLNNSVEAFSFPIKESYRGDVFVHYYFQKFNTQHSGKLRVEVPRANRSLNITTKTFRNKLKPGQNETWELTVSGPDKDKVLAEMLAGMYDSSLDQFSSNDFKFLLSVSDNHSQLSAWKSAGISVAHARDLLPDYSSSRYQKVRLHFDRLNWYGFWRYFVRGGLGFRY